ncbi:MAG: 2'-5' RNA ligase family protein [Candidatus Limnocylindria bacterium]
MGQLRLVHDAVAADGIPAHVTVLYPFVPRDRLTNDVRQATTDVFSAIPAFDYRFDRVGRFGDTTVFLTPEPASAFAGLTDAGRTRWPQHPPYGGVFEVVVPHLTVGDGLDGLTADAVEVAASQALTRHGPVVGRATDVALVTRGADGRWSVDSRHGLAAGG